VAAAQLDEIAVADLRGGAERRAHPEYAVPTFHVAVGNALVREDRAATAAPRAPLAQRRRSGPVDRSIRPQRDTVAVARPLARDVPERDVAVHAFRITLERVAVAAAARRPHHHEIAGDDRMVRHPARPRA
jgi:hypothetical protein